MRTVPWIWTISALVMAGPSLEARATAWHAHPEFVATTLEGVEMQRARFLLTDALHRISLAYDSSGIEERSELKETLLREYSEILFGVPPSPISNPLLEQKFQTALRIWRQTYPSEVAQPLNTSQRQTVSVEETLRWAHAMTRLADRFAHLPVARRVGDSLSRITHGPARSEQSSDISRLQDLFLGLCRGELPEELRPTNNPEWLTFITHSALQSLSRIDSILGESRTCSDLLHDIRILVWPHFSPLGRHGSERGQLEGLSPFLTQEYYSSTRLRRGHKYGPRLMREVLAVRLPLDPELTADDALFSALRGRVPGLQKKDVLFLLALASHNHSIELYLQKAALDLVDDPHDATLLAQESLRGINHLYGLLSAHQSARSRLSTEPLAHALRPYHYWGAAYLACQLERRGYHDWVNRGVGEALANLYEVWSGGTSESLAGSEEDVRMHILGTTHGIEECRNETIGRN